MRIDAYNQVAQLYGVQSNYKTQKTSSVSAPKDQVSISQAGCDYQVAKSAVSQASDYTLLYKDSTPTVLNIQSRC